MKVLSLTYFFGGIGTGVALINNNGYSAMLFGGIALIAKLLFEILHAHENTNYE